MMQNLQLSEPTGRQGFIKRFRSCMLGQYDEARDMPKGIRRAAVALLIEAS